MNDVISIPASLLRQQLFCPRIPFFQEIMGFTPEQPFWVAQGNSFHSRQKKLSSFRGFSRFALEKGKNHFDCTMCSEKLGLHGVADLVIETDNEIFPVDFKTEHKKIYKGQVLQVIAYGQLASEHFGKPFCKAFILSEKQGKTIAYNFDASWQILLNETIEKIRNIFKKGIMPDSPASRKKCIQCEYLNFCNDRL